VQTLDESAVENPLSQLRLGVEAVAVMDEKRLSERWRPPLETLPEEEVAKLEVENPKTFTTTTKTPFKSVRDDTVQYKLGSP
jgi:hypothetical protein